MHRIGEKRLFLLDMDGTIYLDSNLFPFTKDFLKAVNESGRRYVFYTNNSSKKLEDYIEKLAKLGITATDKDMFISNQVIIKFLKANYDNPKLYVVGTPSLIGEFEKAGFTVVEEDPDLVIVGFDTTLTYEKLDNACRLIRGGAEYLSTHPDKNCPTENGFIPDSGGIAALVTTCTDVVPTYFGKPYKETIEMICEATGFDPSEMCIFGDRLYTDIALGKSFGVTSILVLSGETTADDVEAALEKDKPDFVFNSLDDVNKLMF